MLEATRIISFSPHPDDSELIAGGFLAFAAQQGCSIKLVVVSDGSLGYYSKGNRRRIVQIRKSEQFKACRILQITDVEFLGHKDAGIPPPEDLREDFIRIIRGFRPDLVISVDPSLENESHPDHINVGKALLQAVLFHDLPGVIPSVGTKSPPPIIALGATNHPDVAICVDDHIMQKYRSIRAHKSQFSDSEAHRLVTAISSVKERPSKCKQVETFRVLYPSELHLSPSAPNSSTT